MGGAGGDNDVRFATAVATAVVVCCTYSVYWLIRRFVKDSPLQRYDVPLSLRLGFATIPGSFAVGFVCALALLRPYRDSIGLPFYVLAASGFGLLLALVTAWWWRVRARRRGFRPGDVSALMLRGPSRSAYAVLRKAARDRDAET